MKKFFNRILIISLGLILVTNIINITLNISKAAVYSFGFTGPTQAKSEELLTFTITANGLTGNVKLSANNAILSDNQVWVEKNTVTISVKVTAFPAQITATPVELTDNDYNIVNIEPRTITINEKVTTPPPTEPQVPNNQEKNNGQTNNQGNNNQVYQPNQENNEQIPSNPTQSNNEGQRNNQNSNQNNNQNNNQNSGNIDTKSGNNYLKNLQVSVGTLSPEFYRETFEYTVDNVIEEDIEIIAEAEDEKAIVNGAGTVALKRGENRINIEVVAENEQTRTYTIIVNKQEEIKDSDVRLKSLEIQTINEENKFEDLDIGFKKDTLEYNTTVEDNITDLSVLATVEREGIIIEVEGDKNLKEGENVVTITLTNQNINTEEQNITEDENNVKEKTVYMIKVNKKAKPIVEVSSRKVDNKKIIAIGVLLAIIIIAIIIIIIKHRKKGKRRYKSNLKKL